MDEYNESTSSCSSGRRSDNPTAGRTNADQRGGRRYGTDPPTILGGVDINVYENNSVPPMLSVVWDSSLLAIWSAQSPPSLASRPSGTLVTDQQRSLVEVTLAMVDEALAILEDLDDPSTAP